MTKGILFSRFEAGLPIIVTAKDWVKLRERDDLAGHDFWIAEYDLHIEPAGAFRAWLGASLETTQASA